MVSLEVNEESKKLNLNFGATHVFTNEKCRLRWSYLHMKVSRFMMDNHIRGNLVKVWSTSRHNQIESHQIVTSLRRIKLKRSNKCHPLEPHKIIKEGRISQEITLWTSQRRRSQRVKRKKTFQMKQNSKFSRSHLIACFKSKLIGH